MRIKQICWLVVIVLAVAVTAQADTAKMTFTGITTSTTLTIHDSAIGTVTAVIDPYLGTMNGSKVTLFCVDPDHEVNYGDSWTANISYAGGSVANTYLKNATTYGELAWLVTQLAGSSSAAQEQVIQGAIWQLADPSLTFPGASSTFLALVAQWESNAANNALTSGYEILTDVNGKEQEFVVLTPEPATLLLFGSGLLGLGAWGRRKLIKN